MSNNSPSRGKRKRSQSPADLKTKKHVQKHLLPDLTPENLVSSNHIISTTSNNKPEGSHDYSLVVSNQQELPSKMEKPKIESKSKRVNQKTKEATSINLRVGLSIKKDIRSLNYETLKLVYSDNNTLLSFSNSYTIKVTQNKSSKEYISVVESEIPPNILHELSQTKDHVELLDKYKKHSDITGYLYTTFKYNPRTSNNNIIELYKSILTRSYETKMSLKFPKRYDDKKKKTIQENMTTVHNTILELNKNSTLRILEQDYKGNIEPLFQYINKKLEDEKRWKYIAALSDYANTLYAQYRDAMIMPWDIMNTKKGKQTSDTNEQKLAVVYAAQLALESLPPIGQDKTVYRWVGGIEDRQEGDVISPMAFWSASTGTQSSDVFAGEGERTLYVIKSPKSGKFIQLLAGTKNWYQREVLFPAYAQFIVQKKEKQDEDIWYIVEEIEDDIARVDDKELKVSIGLKISNTNNIGNDMDVDGKNEYIISEELLTNTLVDFKHRELFNNGKPSKKELKAAGVELSNDIDINTISVENVYGMSTHETWTRLMKQASPRLELLTEKKLKEYYTEISESTPENIKYRDHEVGWGDNNYYPDLTSEQRKALTEHGLRYYPTISQKDKTEFIDWIEKKLKTWRTIPTTGGTSQKPTQLGRLKYIEAINDNNKERIAINEDIMTEFEKHNNNTQKDVSHKYEVSYGEVDEIGMSEIVGGILSRIGAGIEQTLALYNKSYINEDVYRKRVQRYATDLQQEIASAHPFEDGNGRLSRLMMYKVLQIYLPTSEDDISRILPVIEDPDKDLLMSKDEWYNHIFTSRA